MAELGWLDDGARMGMLDAQRFRAARVVIDIGVHLGGLPLDVLVSAVRGGPSPAE